MSIIYTRIFGGLGNQLFIYAASRRLAILNDSELVIDDVSGFEYDWQYRRHYQLDHFAIPCRKANSTERFEPFSRVRRKIMRMWNARLPFEQRRYLVQDGYSFESRLLDLRPSSDLYLEGYWQSESYFKDVELQIRQDLRIIPPKDLSNLYCAKNIHQGPSVSVHVRFFEDPVISENVIGNNVTASYYDRAVQRMESLISEPHYFLFSDRPEAARKLIPIPDDRITIVNHNQGDLNAFADLWLMTQCQNFIIANSTFSWWGAWLAENPSKVVIAPKLSNSPGGAWSCSKLLPDTWCQL